MNAKLVISVLLIVALSSKLIAQQKVSVVIAKKENKCGDSIDLGFSWFSSQSQSASDLRKKAKSKVISDNYDYESTESITEFNGCTYMIIISSKIKDGSCYTLRYGVGFANDRSSALHNAKKNLTGRNWKWSSSRDGFTIVEEKLFY